MRRFLALAAICWVAPLAIFYWLSRPGSAESERLWGDRGSPRFATIGQRDDSGTQAASIELKWSESVPIFVGASEGRVTDVYAAENEIPSSGAAAIGVNGHLVVFQVGGVPLYRMLGLGDTGRDVEALATILAGATRRPLSTRSTVDDEMVAAITDFYAQSGLAKDEFDPADTIFVPDSTPLTAISVRLGQVLVGGEQFSTLRPSVTAAELVLDGSTSRRSVLDGKELVIRDGNGFEVRVPSMTLDQVALDKLSMLAPTGAPVLDGLSVGLVEPIVYGTVPASAVVSMEDGTRCIFVLNATETLITIQLTAEHLSSSEPGIQPVDLELIGQQVLINPSATTEADECD